MKSFYIITFGCQMNEHDSERMAGILEERNLVQSDAPESADIIILNTCSIRQKAEQKFYSELGRVMRLKKKKPDITIAVAGCIAQQEGALLISRASEVDMVFGPSDISRLSEMIDRRVASRSLVVETSGDPDHHKRHIPLRRSDRIKAWVSIMYGCDNFCTYCVVPYLRGRERSRPAQDIISEVKKLAEDGYKEVTLLGQNVNSYGKGLDDHMDFPRLLSMVNDFTGIERIRFVTSHPRDLSDGLIYAIRDLPKVCEALHLPVQSGSDSILALMNRRYTRGEYLEKVKRLRDAVPGITLTTDVIVGFPGETDRDFEMTLSLIEEVGYDSIFAFKYSRRPNTAALDLPGHLPEEVKEERLEEVLRLQRGITIQKNRDLVGTIQEVLLDGRSRDGTKLQGRSRGNKVVNVPGPASLIGSIVNIRITKAGVNSLSGEISPSV